MADLAYRNDIPAPALRRTDWGAIWAGVFCFLGIWSVFGMLGVAIFASAANPNAAQPVTGMSVGEAAWGIVLTAIAMYVAGRETGRLANVDNKTDGLVHGLIMFGLGVIAALILTILGGATLSGGTGVEAGAHNPYILSVFTWLGWGGFVALLLGWIGAMAGASQSASSSRMGTAVRTEQRTTENTRSIRPAA